MKNIILVLSMLLSTTSVFALEIKCSLPDGFALVSDKTEALGTGGTKRSLTYRDSKKNLEVNVTSSDFNDFPKMDKRIEIQFGYNSNFVSSSEGSNKVELTTAYGDGPGKLVHFVCERTKSEVTNESVPKTVTDNNSGAQGSPNDVSAGQVN